MKIRLLHPIFFTLASLLFLYKNAWVIASPDQVVRPFLILGISLLLLALPSYWIVRKPDWIALLLTIFVLGFFSPNLIFVISGALSVAVLIIYHASFFILKYRTQLQHISVLLTLTSLFLIAMIVIPHADLFVSAFGRASSPISQPPVTIP